MNEPRRIRVPRRPTQGDAKKTIDRLVEDGPFQTKQKAMMFAAALGHHAGKREAFSSADEPIRWGIFENAGDDPFLAALAVAEAGGLEALSDGGDEDYPTVFEEYANGGLMELEERVLDQPADVLDQLIRLLTAARRRDEASPQGLEGLTSDQLDAIGL
jgi:dnd system-associated protein 4